ncbi:MAG: hypothetical protein KBT46_08180 [Ruminococcus sp.]|nr:hypothetical protein [Candidatus Copronaster equi]
MFIKIISLITSFLMLFQFAFPIEPELKKSDNVLREPEPQFNSLRTYDKINGAAQSDFYIERPNENLNEIKASDFGMSVGRKDNYPAFKSALDYCKANPGTKLIFDKGTYYFNNISALKLNGFRDIKFEGNDTLFIFSNVVVGFEIRNCDCVEFNNIKFDWDWDKLPLSDIVKVKNASAKNNSLDFVFPELDEVDENTIFSAISQCDSETLTYGAKYSNKEVYVYQKPEMIKSVKKTENNVLHIEHDGCFDKFKNGDTFILRHYVYDVTFTVINGGSKNITFDNVSVYGYPGAGFYVGEKSSHFQIINSYIGINPDYKTSRHTSLGADAIHIVNSDGCFNIANCDISGQGDDALNVHDGLGKVSGVDSNKITLVANAMFLNKGDIINFRDEKFNETDFSAEIKELEYHSDGTYYDITFDKDVSDQIRNNFIAYNTSCCSDNYVLKNNYIHENRARGFLLQSSNGLCENNTFYKTEMQAIKIVMDISTGLWYEGTGVDRLFVKNNIFTMCDYIGTGEVITIGTNIDGKIATSQPFTNIEITGNTFKELTDRVLNANNINGLVFSSNVIDAGKQLPKNKFCTAAFFGKYSSNISFENNLWINCIFCEIINSDNIAVWAKINSK